MKNIFSPGLGEKSSGEAVAARACSGKNDAFARRVRVFTLWACAAGCLFLAACGKPRPLTFEEQEVYMAKQQCWQEATDMNPEWPSPYNPAWNSYFYMCMNSLGISPEAIDRIWE